MKLFKLEYLEVIKELFIFLKDIVSPNIAIIGVIIAAFTFWKTFGKMKKSEQIKLTHDIQLMYSNAQKEYIKTIDPNLEVDEMIQKVAYMEVLNVLEWASFLIRKNQIDRELQQYFLPLILQALQYCKKHYPALLDNKEEYSEIKLLTSKF
jgi:hypothetical protein